ITWILAVEAEATGTVSLGRFYRARTLRLLPAYCTTIVLVLAGSRLFGLAEGDAFYCPAHLWPLVLTFPLNIWIAAAGDCPWGVGVDEKCRLAWAGIGKRWGPARILPFALCALPALAVYRSAWYLWMNRGHLTEPSTAAFFRIYYATDTRIDAILVGCALALL